MRISVPFPGARDRAALKAPGSPRQRWLLLPVALAVVAGLVFWWLPSRLAPATPTTTATVGQGSLTLAVSGSGAVAAARTVELPFQQAGTVTAVNVQVGDQVKAGQALAQIDDSDLKLQLQQAQANLKSAEAKLAQAQGGSPTPQDLANAQAALQSAKAQLTKTKTANVTDLQNAQAQLAAAQAKLDALKNPSPANITSAQTQLAQAQTDLQNKRDSLSQAKSNANTQMQQAANALTQAQSKYATAKQNWDYVQSTGNDPAQPTKTGADGKTKANKLNDTQRQQYYDAFVQAEAALHSAEQSLQQAQVNYDTARQNEASQIPLAEQQVANAQAQLDALMHPTANDLQQAQSAVTQARANLTALQGGGTAASLASAQAQVTQAQSSLDALTAPAAAPDLASAEAGLVQAQAAVATAQRNLDLATLKAPFDGVVSAVSVQPGALASTGASTAAVPIVDRSKLHIDISLSESDAAKVAVGQPVSLTFDALPNATLNGKVATVAPAATVSQNVVTYPVQVEFDPGTTPVKVGMSATADIQVQQVDNAILVPSRAVQTTGNQKSVTVLQGAKQVPVTVQVETGAASNGQTQILSCVDTGAQCLRPGDVLSIPSTTATSAQQGANRGGFGPGGGGVRVPFGGGR
jgi:HlyD family secretion protein